MAKRLLIICSSVLLVLIATLALLPFLFQKKLNASIQKELKLRYTARIDYSNLNLSFYKDFPRISISLKELTVTDNDSFTDDTLASVEHLDISVDLRSLIKGDKYQVQSVKFISPKLYVHIDSFGNSNWNIERSLADSNASPTANVSGDSTHFSLDVMQFQIKDGSLKYVNDQKHISFETPDFAFTGDGHKDNKCYELNAGVVAYRTDYKQNDSVIFQRAKFTSDLKVKIDPETGKWTLVKSTLSLNEFAAELEGTIAPYKDSVILDLAFQTKETDFNNVMPLLRSRDLEKMKIQGIISMDGKLKGVVFKHNFPALSMHLNLKNGNITNNALPVPLRKVEGQLTLTKPEGAFDSMLLEFSKLSFETAGKSNLNLSGRVENLIPYLDGKQDLRASIQLQGKMLDLDELKGKNKIVPAAINSTSAIANTQQSSLKPTDENFKDKADLAIAINGIQRVQSDKLIMENVKGNLHLKDGIFEVEDFVASTCGGTIKCSGQLGASHKNNSSAAIKAEIIQCDINRACAEFSAEKVSPQLRDIQGNFSSQVNVKFKMKPDWSLDYNTLEGTTSIQIPTAKVSQIPALTEIARQAKINSLQNLEMTNMVSNIKFGQGKVIVAPTDMKFTNGYALRIGGWNDYDQHINYDMHLEMPTKEFGATASLAQNLLSGLGIGLNVPKNVGFTFKVTGTFDKPDVQLLKVGE